MLTITIPEVELFNEETQEFIKTPERILELEHSLSAISKWESIYEKPFLGPDDKTEEEILTYVDCMLLTGSLSEDERRRLMRSWDFSQVNDYINAKKTATWFSDDSDKKAPGKTKVTTSEVIYYWMISLNIPWECQYWHLNRLLTLIRVINVHTQPAKKMSRAEAARKQRELNAERKRKYNTAG